MEYLRRFVLWFFSGLGLAAGIAVVAWLYRDASERKLRTELERTLPASLIEITGIEPIAIGDTASVGATLQNNSLQTVGATLELSIAQGSKTLYSCEPQAVSTPAPGNAARVQVSCRGVQRSEVPANATYQLRAVRVIPVP